LHNTSREGRRIVPGNIAHVRRLERYRFFAADVPGKVVLDCACGPGFGTAVLSRAGARRVVAVDISERALEHTARHCAELRNVETLRADVTHLPFDDETFDVVVSSETVEHVADWTTGFAELIRVMKPEGTFDVSMPNRPVFSAFRLGSASPMHVRETSLRGLRLRLEKLFEEVEMFGQDFQRRGDVFCWTRRCFNAWAPTSLRQTIVRLKDWYRKRSSLSGGAAGEPVDSDVFRVIPLEAHPGWVPMYAIGRCRKPRTARPRASAGQTPFRALAPVGHTSRREH